MRKGVNAMWDIIAIACAAAAAILKIVCTLL